MASSFLRFLDHTQRRTTVGRTPVNEGSARRRDLYLTTHNTHNRQTSMPRWDSNPRSQQASGRRPTPSTAWPLGPAVKTLYNEKWEIETVNKTNICENYNYIIAAGFKLTLSTCDCVNKRQFYNKTPFVFREIFRNFNCMKYKEVWYYRST